MRKATRADMRECTRYDVDMTARVEVEWAQLQSAHPRHQRIRHRIDKRPELAVGAQIVVTFDGLHPVSGRIVRVHDGTVGICFEPQRLKIEEVRRLVTAVAAA